MTSPAQAHPFGPFYLERRIAVGGSAEVYLARPKNGVRPAAQLVVKRLLPSLRENHDFSVLEQEAELHRAVVHPNVVTVYGAGLVGKEPYIALEFVDGVDLYRLLRRLEAEQHRLPPAVAVYIARSVALALGAVHGAHDEEGRPLHIVHRDITPSNVYLSVTGDVKVGDFGIARTTREGSVATAGLKGKFGYLAPEQVAGEPFDHRADLFASCVLLGEMLVGERIFPGSGQLAVLLAIRDGNIERLKRERGKIPPQLYAICERGLHRDPDQRFTSAAELAETLLPHELPGADELREQLSTWVRFARDTSQLANLHGKIRDSVKAMQAVRTISSNPPAGDTLDIEIPVIRPIPIPPPSVAPATRRWNASGGPSVVLVKRHDNADQEKMDFPRLLELLATGQLSPRDSVAFGEDGQMTPIHQIPQLLRLLLPSSTQTTTTLSGPGIPDYHCLLPETPMLEALARMRRGTETGVLFVSRSEGAEQKRKEIYLLRGRLHHVASSEREELLGEYLVRRGALTRAQLDHALGELATHGGRLGDRLLSMGLVEAMTLFRAIRDQGRDRVAALCNWGSGEVSFYRGPQPGHVDFPLDLDLASPMMAGALLLSRGAPRALLPDGGTMVEEGPRAGHCAYRAERGTAPVSLQLVPEVTQDHPTIDLAIERLVVPRHGRDRRAIQEPEACAALVTARYLGWIEFPGRPTMV